MAIYFIDEPYYLTHTAGSKPRNDINVLNKKLNFTSVLPLLVEKKSFFYKGDIIIFQYTLNQQWHFELFDFAIANGIHTVLIIHDIISIRENDIVKQKEEFELFNKCSVLIVHNIKMKNYLEVRGVTTKMICLTLFDYLLPSKKFKDISSKKLSNNIIFAGNLNPKMRGFLYNEKNDHDFHLNLYGPEVEEYQLISKSKYYGSYEPDEIPNQLNGAFGLVWNGMDSHTCTGNIGHYTSLITSHKYSLYFVSKLPVVCWENDAMANFVLDNNLGFVVKDQKEIDHVLINLTEQEYNQMVENIEGISYNLSKGYYYSKVIYEAIIEIE
ncbi:MAG: hypothetical protein ACRCST_17090 [Turicibacter sp.]